MNLLRVAPALFCVDEAEPPRAPASSRQRNATTSTAVSKTACVAVAVSMIALGANAAPTTGAAADPQKNSVTVAQAGAAKKATAKTTAVNTAAANTGTAKGTSPKAKLLGKHMLSLQWILFDNSPYGTAIVSEKNGVMSIHGEQKGKHGNYLKIDGVVSDVKATSFVFEGEITTKVHHINDGAPCVREVKDATFAAKGNRKYWRMQDWKNPCSEVTDYVDVYFH